MCVPTCPKRISARQQHRACGAAYRGDIEISKFHTRRAQLVDVGSLVLLTAVASQPVFSKIIKKNEDDIGPVVHSV